MKVVYIFGAGLSYGSIPMVNELTYSNLKIQFQKIRENPSLWDNIKSQKIGEHTKPIQIQEMWDEFVEQVGKSVKNWNPSPDYFLRSLYHPKKSTRKYLKEKIIFRTCMAILHYVPMDTSKDLRIFKYEYDYKGRYSKFLNNINRSENEQYIINWNYDLLFIHKLRKINLDEYYESGFINSNQFNKAGILQIHDHAQYLAINGNVSISYNERDSAEQSFIPEGEFNLSMSRGSAENNIKLILSEYWDWKENGFYRGLYDGVHPEFHFFFEQNEHRGARYKVAEDFLSNADKIITFGYSFPPYNKDFNQLLLDKSKDTDLLVFDPYLDKIKENIKQINGQLDASGIFYNSNCEEILVF
ncbi:MAG: hypothetical protein ACFHWX_06115 [Bacteroidota bacterium]